MRISYVIQKLQDILEKEGDLKILLEDTNGHTYTATQVQTVEGPHDQKMVTID
jgi:hypothetical protein